MPPLVLRPRRREPRYDRQILQIIARLRTAELRQVGWLCARLWQISETYVYRRIRQLRRDRFVRQERIDGLDPRRLALVLTPKGYVAIHEQFPREAPAKSCALRSWRLQAAEMRIVRWAEGWEEVQPDQAWEVARAWAVRRFKERGPLTPTAHQELDRLRRSVPDGTMPPVLVRRDAAGTVTDLRLIVHVVPGTSIRRALAALPRFHFFPTPMAWEVVCHGPLWVTFHQVQRRWGRTRRATVKVHAVRPFAARQNPIPQGASRSTSTLAAAD